MQKAIAALTLGQPHPPIFQRADGSYWILLNSCVVPMKKERGQWVGAGPVQNCDLTEVVEVIYEPDGVTLPT